MALKEMASPPLPNVIGNDVAALARRQADAMADMQREFCEQIERTNRDLIARMDLERSLASDLLGRLSSAHALPDIATAYQTWLTRRMELLAEDSKRLLAASQEFMKLTTQFWSSGVQDKTKSR